jgi:hypothetical protein
MSTQPFLTKDEIGAIKWQGPIAKKEKNEYTLSTIELKS